MNRATFKRTFGHDLAAVRPGAAGRGAASEPAGPRRDPVRWLILCGIALIAMIGVGTAATVSSFRDRALNSSARELENTLLLLGRHFDQQLEDRQVIQNDLIAYMQSAGINSGESFSRLMSSRDIHLMLNAKLGALSYVGSVNVFDADGKLINSSLAWPVPAVSIADRVHFKAFKSDPRSPALLLAPVHSRITGAWTTVLARKIVGPDGEFLGVITRGIEPAHFEKFFASLSLGDNASISMFHRDGTLLARFPHVDRLIGHNFSTGPLFQRILPKARYGTMRIVSPVDGEDRLGSIRALHEFPIVIIATTTVASALADWRAQTHFLIGVAGLSSLVIAFMIFLIVRQLVQQHRRSQQKLTLEKQRLDTAVNNMNQGLLLFDSSHRLVVCNKRYLDMYGLSSDVIRPGCSFRDVIVHSREAGSFQGDVDEHCQHILRNLGPGSVTITEIPDGRAIQMLFQPVADGGWVSTHEDITERRRSDARIAHLAQFDALTDLPNRVLFREKLEAMLQNASDDMRLAVLYIDIDEFKSVNDSLGHPIGDELLKAVAHRLRGCARQADLVARLGGDEFAIVQANIKDTADITELVARVYEAIRVPIDCLGHLLSADASIGIAIAPADGAELDELLKNADLAMYAAKAGGRRTYRFFDPAMNARAQARRMLELELRQAMANSGFELHYQPLLHLRTNEIAGCEALLRWQHPERGVIPPAEFIPVAEDTGLIDPLGAWVLTTACCEAATWPDTMKLAVNVSPVQFRNPAFALKVAAALAASGLAASRLQLEITEAVLIRDDDVALAILHQLRALGICIALDDFGTGYSSLSYLQRFPFDKIKIDRCFVSDVTEPDGSLSIVEAVVNIATARNMITTAEGVETPEQQALLRRLGCTEMQGYLFSPPRPAAEIRQLFCTHRVAAMV